MLTSNWLALLITFAVALTWLRINDFAAHRGWIGSRLSRKLIHIGTGPLFVLCWLLFTPAPASRYLAALVPLLFTLQFVLIGLGIVKDEASVQAMSRTGDRREILRGPVFYGLVFVVMTLLYWLESPIGMVALMLMCGGDGLADIREAFRQAQTAVECGNRAGGLGMLVGLILAFLILWAFVALKHSRQHTITYLR
jgi:phytol kinase